MVLTSMFLDILVRWRIYIEECGLRGLCKQTRDFSFPEFKSKGRIDVGSFLNLADLIWGELPFLLQHSTICTTNVCNLTSNSQILSEHMNRIRSFKFPGSRTGS